MSRADRGRPGLARPPDELMLAPGMRRTAQRTMVYNAIVRLGGHCTADELATEILVRILREALWRCA